MALMLNSDAQTVFFSKVFGPEHPVTKQVKALIATGTTFEIGLYDIKASGKGESTVNLTHGSTSLMKGAVANPTLLEFNKTTVENWVLSLYLNAGSPILGTTPTTLVTPGPVTSTPTPMEVMIVGTTLTNLIPLTKAIKTVTGWSLVDAKKAADAVMAGSKKVSIGVFPTLESANAAVEALKTGDVEAVVFPPTVYPVPAAVAPVAVVAKPVDAVIALKDAKALGQKVHGTSTGSVYRCIALTEHVKVAARIYQSGSISIRAEWTDNPTSELKKLEDSGVQMKSHYGSIHFNAESVPLPRVIGAFLVGTGINWKAAVMNGTDLIIDGNPS